MLHGPLHFNLHSIAEQGFEYSEYHMILSGLTSALLTLTDMSVSQELSSWLSPTKVETKPIPCLDSQAPASSEITFPRQDGKPVIITFLRHCGCPCMIFRSLFFYLSYPDTCSCREDSFISAQDSRSASHRFLHCSLAQRQARNR